MHVVLAGLPVYACQASRYDESDRTLSFRLCRNKESSFPMPALKMLVVEDDAANLELMVELLEQLKSVVSQ
jgi:hypothetical protein